MYNTDYVKYIKYKTKYTNQKKNNQIGGHFESDNIEKTVKVVTPFGIALLNLYKINVDVKMLANQVSSYQLHPIDGTSLLYANENTIFISDIPSLKGYTFKVKLINNTNSYTNLQRPSEYIVTRLS